MNNRTFKNDPDNRSEDELKKLFPMLRPIWQGYEESNLDLGFWRPSYWPLYYTPLCPCYYKARIGVRGS